MNQGKTIFKLPIRVYIEDTDAGGIVFYANYLKYMERARTEFVRSLGIQLRGSFKLNVSFVVHSLEVKYNKSAYLDDELFVTAELEKVARSYMVFQQNIFNSNNECITTAKIKVACIDLESSKPKAMMSDLYKALNTYQSTVRR